TDTELLTLGCLLINNLPSSDSPYLDPEATLLLWVHRGANRTAPSIGKKLGVLGNNIGSVDSWAVHVLAVFLVAFLAHHLTPDLGKGDEKYLGDSVVHAR
ncbi:hypothetical protein OTU49_016272, partial [Cherax quadricarinatus]